MNNSVTVTENKTTTKETLKEESFLTSFMEGDQLYLKIPNSFLDKPILFTRHDTSYQSDQYSYMQVVWSLYRDKIILKAPRIQSTTGTIIPFLKNPSLRENILRIFLIDKEKSNSKVNCINITNLILNQAIEWTPEVNETLLPSLSLIINSKNLSNEVIISTRRGLVNNQSKVSIPVYFSFYYLPQQMKSRQFDYRMGFYNEEKSSLSHGTKNGNANFSKWRLEKINESKKIDEPIKPITFLLSPEIPDKWKSYVKAGIEEWLPAFRSAGFKNALIVKEVDSLEDWKAHSLNYSIVRWGNKRNVRGFEDNKGSTISNVIDLRTGEIIKSDILIGSSYQHLADQYFIRCAPLDKRAQQYPFPDDLMGELIQFVVAHEAGHTFGIADNHYGEFSYPFEKMNNKKWLEEMGHTPSIMTYARHNNIAQPEDSIPPSLLIQKVGPTDYYYIKWAYITFPGHFSSNDEEAELERIIRLQDSCPWYRYNNEKYEIIGPASTNQVVDNDNPVKSTRMALKNLKKVIELLPEVNRGQKDNARLERLYDKALNLWYHHMRHVVSLIGGYDIFYKSLNQRGRTYTPIAQEFQIQAIDFLILNAFNPPGWLVNPEFNSKIKYSTYPDKILEYQQMLLFELLRPQRMKRLEYLENSLGNEYAPQRFLSKLQLGLFEELSKRTGSVDSKKQEIQSTYIDKLILIIEQKRLNINANKKAQDYTDYSKGIVMEQLKALEKSIAKKVKKNKEHNSMGHWMLCLKKLNEIL